MPGWVTAALAAAALLGSCGPAPDAGRNPNAIAFTMTLWGPPDSAFPRLVATLRELHYSINVADERVAWVVAESPLSVRVRGRVRVLRASADVSVTVLRSDSTAATLQSIAELVNALKRRDSSGGSGPLVPRPNHDL